MALTAGQTIALALEASHGRGKQQQAVLLYNSILTELCQTYDFAEARGQYLFNFSTNPAPPPALTAWPQWPGNTYGSGPYLMPVDYLRLSGSSGSSGSQKSFVWWLNGVPYPVIPMDLAEFDLQVQQAGLQSFVWLSATDMSTPIDDRIMLTTTGNTQAGNTIVTGLGSVARLLGGGVMGIAGQGIVPGSMLLSLGGPLGLDATISRPANATISGASLIIGYCPVVFIYPPPQSALQAMIRYQRRMPDIADLTRYPWFHHDRHMLDVLTGALCQLNDDERAQILLAGPEVPGSPAARLGLWLAGKDDDPSHPKRVELDRRAFGRGRVGAQNRITKLVGW